jgi:uncharacterized protein YegP (UPF0339 family)
LGLALVASLALGGCAADSNSADDAQGSEEEGAAVGSTEAAASDALPEAVWQIWQDPGTCGWTFRMLNKQGLLLLQSAHPYVHEVDADHAVDMLISQYGVKTSYDYQRNTAILADYKFWHNANGYFFNVVADNGQYLAVGRQYYTELSSAHRAAQSIYLNLLKTRFSTNIIDYQRVAYCPQ